MRLARGAVGLVLAVAVVALIGAVAFERRLIKGARDPGAVDFASLQRLASGDDALICPKSLCLRAKSDLEPPIFTVSAARLREKLLAYARGAPFTDQIHVKPGSQRLRFMQRVSTFASPLFIDILVVPRTAHAATLAMYARGAGPSSFDHENDLSRLRSWMDALSN